MNLTIFLTDARALSVECKLGSPMLLFLWLQSNCNNTESMMHFLFLVTKTKNGSLSKTYYADMFLHWHVTSQDANKKADVNVNILNNVNNEFIERTGTRVSSVLRCHLQYCANRNVFNWWLKLSIESSGSRRYSGKLFQMVGPTTAN